MIRVVNGLVVSVPCGGWLLMPPNGYIINPRVGLDLKSREIAVVAALTALGTATPQLKVHVNGALNVGLSVRRLLKSLLR